MTVTTQAVRCDIDGIPSNTPAWELTNVDELLKPADTRGADGVVIINAHGRLAQKMWRDGSTRILQWVIYGDRDRDGVVYSDPWVGAETNLAYLHANVIAIPATADSTRTLTLHLPSGATRTAAVQVRDFDWTTKGGPTLFGVMELYLPSGAPA